MAAPLPFMPDLEVGAANNPAVKALGRALAKVLGPGYTRNNRSGWYGRGMVHDVALFKQKNDLAPADGTVWGQRAWALIAPHVDDVGRTLLEKAKREHLARVARYRANAELLIRSRIRAAALYGVSQNERIVYRLYRPFAVNLRASGTLVSDCSGFSKACYYMAGAKNPDGIPGGYGYTGSLWVAGRAVSRANLRVGDLVFYGNFRADHRLPGHVAVYIGGGAVATFGSEPGPRILPVGYRSDIRGYRTYDLI